MYSKKTPLSGSEKITLVSEVDLKRVDVVNRPYLDLRKATFMCLDPQKVFSGSIRFSTSKEIPLKKLAPEKQLEYLAHCFSIQWGEDVKLKKYDKRNKIKHGFYILKLENSQKLLYIYVHVAFVFWKKIYNSRKALLGNNCILIVGKTPRQVENGEKKPLFSGGNSQIIGVNYFFAYHMSTNMVSITKIRERDFYLKYFTQYKQPINLDSLPFRKYIKETQKGIGSWPFDLPLGYRKGKCTFVSLYLTEAGEQELFKHINEYKDEYGTLKSKLLLMIDLLEALEKIHNLGFVHRDIKPENIVIDRIKKKVASEKIEYIFKPRFIDIEDMKKNCNDDCFPKGTFAFIPREVAINLKFSYTIDNYYLDEAKNITSYASDIYSLGLIFILLLQEDPVKSYNVFNDSCHIIGATTINIKERWEAIQLKIWKKFFEDIKSLGSINSIILEIIQKMINQDPNKRYKNVSDIIQALGSVVLQME